MTVSVSFLWHMHQPYYKDVAHATYVMPWAFLHGIKDYFGMPALASEFPDVHQTFNLAPSLIVQLEDYAAGQAHDPFVDLMIKPAESLNDTDRATIRHRFLSIPVRSMIEPIPRFLELYLQANDPNAPAFSERDYRDVQVCWLLAWMDQDRRPPEMAARRGHFDETDKALLLRLASELIQGIVPLYRRLSHEGTIELSASPFYHPIVPLLLNSRVDDPNVPVDVRVPDDAREQLLRARRLFADRFGREPRGLWPSEGSVSDEAAALVESLGFDWMATDEGILRKSGVSLDGDARLRLFQPFLRRGLRIFFRDRGFSDLIGFHYMHGEAREGAEDLLRRLRGLPEGAHVTIALDGENPWDHYLNSGRDFLRFLFDGIQNDPSLQAITLSEASDRFPAETIEWLAPGSWAGSNFSIWMGHEEDHEAWWWIVQAREALLAQKGRVEASDWERAYDELLVAEGSDWMWWFGADFSTEYDAVFDGLFRQHVANVFRFVGLTPPPELARPIKKSTTGGAGLVMVPESRNPST